MAVATVEDIRRIGAGTQPPGFPVGDGLVDLTNLDPFEVYTLHRTVGMEYELQQPGQPWSWRRMLAGFNDATLERIVGPGVRRIVCMSITGSYDHKRHHAARLANRQYPPDAPVPVWDFVVERTDGTRVRFHAGQTKRKVEIADYDFALERDGPAAGRGQSDGPGTYRAMLANTHNEVGSFQPTVAECQANRERARGRGRHTRGGSARTRGGGGRAAMAAPPQQPSASPAQPPSAVPGAYTRGGRGGAAMAVPPQPLSAVTAQPPGLAASTAMSSQQQPPAGPLPAVAATAAPAQQPPAAPLPAAANQQQFVPDWTYDASGQWIWTDWDSWRWTDARGWWQVPMQ